MSSDDYETDRLCDREGCDEPAPYRAPKSTERLRDYYHFCLEHIRDYNANWDFYGDYSPEEIGAQQKSDMGWDRPTWPASAHPRLEARLRKIAAMLYGAKASADTEPGQEKGAEDTQKPGNQPLPPQMKALEVLELETDVSMADIKKRYRELARQWHPDKNPNDKKAEETFKRINAAYVVLQQFYIASEDSKAE